jgi:hypothetical protein
MSIYVAYWARALKKSPDNAGSGSPTSWEALLAQEYPQEARDAYTLHPRDGEILYVRKRHSAMITTCLSLRG